MDPDASPSTPPTPEALTSGWDLSGALSDLGPTLLELGMAYGLRLLGALLILLAAWLLGRLARNALTSVLHRTSTDETVTSFLGTLVRWSILVLGVLTCLGVFGIEATSLAALLGGAGVGIGVALQGNLSNLASGLLLIAFRPFKAGDWIELTSSGVDGKVTKVGLLYTELDTFRRQRIVLPNQLLFDQAVLNQEWHPVRRVDLKVGVAYKTDLDHADDVLRKLVRSLQDEHGTDVGGREPVVWWDGFGGSSINVTIGVWCETGDIFHMQNYMIIGVHKALREAGIEIPFPQRDLHLRAPNQEWLEKQLDERLAAK